ncbi:MAG: hypothetical protein M1827_000711 [Pycnora praestabilis]|nr:MAG: hypothetical protein M1827_000711 [Pycnora praestabilis]
MPDGKALPTIVYNGNVILDAVSFQNTFEKQMPATHFEVQAYDCHVINPNYTAVGSERSSGVSGKNMTILVIVSGYIRLGESRDGAMRGFSETFVLVPNPDPANAKGPKHLRKDWLIQSQNFRLVI